MPENSRNIYIIGRQERGASKENEGLINVMKDTKLIVYQMIIISPLYFAVCFFFGGEGVVGLFWGFFFLSREQKKIDLIDFVTMTTNVILGIMTVFFII